MNKTKVRKRMMRKRRMICIFIGEIAACVILGIAVAGVVRTSVSAEGKDLYERSSSKKLTKIIIIRKELRQRRKAQNGI